MLFVIVSKSGQKDTYETDLVPNIGDEFANNASCSCGEETLTIKRRIFFPSGDLMQQLSTRYGFNYNPNIDNKLDAFLYAE